MSIIETLKDHDIKSVWHFTDKSNLKSIEKYGILSLEEILKNDVDVSRFGANEYSHDLDRSMGLDKYVHLAFIDDHPMYHVAKRRGSILEPIWIELDFSLILEDTTLFSDQVANSRYAEIFHLNDIERRINFDTMLGRFDSQKRRVARKAEIMVANNISVNKILGVYYGK